MVLKLEQFSLEGLATKNTFRVLRLLVLKPYLSWGLSELSLELKIAKSNVLRIMNVLIDYNIVLVEKSGRKKLYHVNHELKLVSILWELFMEEKKQNISYDIKNTIDLLFNQVKEDVELFILFGSVAQGLATRKSDIDLCVVSQNHIDVDRFDFLPHRFEIHQYSWDDIKEPVDFVVLDALLNGVVWKGNILKILARTRYFSKTYLIYRLKKSKDFLDKSKNLEGNAKEYYEEMAEITVGEVKSILSKGETTPKRKIKVENINQEMKELEIQLAQEGERIWLM